VIDAPEGVEDYATFEMAVTADAQSAVERELVLRLFISGRTLIFGNRVAH
jgi:hypothetical protein